MKLYEEFKNEKLLEDHFKPLLDGHALQKEFKLKPGPQLKDILQSLREAQIEGAVKNKKEAKKFVEGYLSDG